MSEQQVLNYLYWLRERGQSYCVPSLPPLAPASIPPEPEKAATVPLDLASHETLAASPSFKVVFLSRGPLESAEREMVSRIAAALALGPTDFCIRIEEEGIPPLAPGGALVIMGGEESERPVPQPGIHHSTLTIPHPRAMLREPRLKIAAWETLQKLKAAL